MDLLRAIAILLVLFAHTILSYGAPSSLAPLQLGGTGVQLFFLLSGWLLGSQLFKEAERTGNIDIKKFWARRWMRTLPAYYAVLIASVLQRYLTKENVVFPWEYFVFIQNYDQYLQFFYISWSLCVEEQFYLLIAPLIAILTKTNRYTTTLTLVTLLLLPSVFRSLGWYDSMSETHVSIDCCVMGVLLAQIYHQYSNVWSSASRYATPLAVVGLIFYVMFYAGRYFPELGITDPDQLVLAILFSTWVLAANSQASSIHRLKIPGAYYIATRSFALYLLHPEVLALLKRYCLDLPFIAYLCLALICSALLAEALYRVIEKPFMDAREKYSLSAKVHL